MYLLCPYARSRSSNALSCYNVLILCVRFFLQCFTLPVLYLGDRAEKGRGRSWEKDTLMKHGGRSCLARFPCASGVDAARGCSTRLCIFLVSVPLVGCTGCKRHTAYQTAISCPRFLAKGSYQKGSFSFSPLCRTRGYFSEIRLVAPFSLKHAPALSFVFLVSIEHSQRGGDLTRDERSEHASCLFSHFPFTMPLHSPICCLCRASTAKAAVTTHETSGLKA